MRTIERSSAFKSDYKREKKGQHSKTIEDDLTTVLELLANDQPLPERYRDHALGGGWEGHRDLHVHPDLVLIYRKPIDGKTKKDLQVLRLVRLGSHSELEL